jgi:hypothetical protein
METAAIRDADTPDDVADDYDWTFCHLQILSTSWNRR